MSGEADSTRPPRERFIEAVRERQREGYFGGNRLTTTLLIDNADVLIEDALVMARVTIVPWEGGGESPSGPDPASTEGPGSEPGNQGPSDTILAPWRVPSTAGNPPLVVLDPDDPGDVERLARALAAHLDRGTTHYVARSVLARLKEEGISPQ